jgi:hypothetical protein
MAMASKTDIGRRYANEVKNRSKRKRQTSETAALYDVALKRDNETEKNRKGHTLGLFINVLASAKQLPSPSCRYSKTHRGFGGGLGVRWVTPE